jgi:beta-lactamase class A
MLYRAVEDGALALDDRVRYEPQHRCLGSGVLSLMAPGVEMSVRDAATLMIVISDNSATNICVDLVGLDRINAYMRSLGMPRTELYQRWGERRGDEPPTARGMWVSSAAETAQLFAMIGRHELVSPDASEDMLRILRRCQSRVELSGEMPWNEMNMLDDPQRNWVAEKGGAWIGVRCGGAVFHSPGGEFAMAAFTEASSTAMAGHDSAGNQILGALGKAAYDALAS